MQVIAHDPYVPSSRASALGVELFEFEALLAQADVVTLHVPLTPATRGMVDARVLGLMREDAVLVNCARGGVVDAQALLDALASGRLRAAAIDVFPEEPPPPGSASARLMAHPAVISTPHLGGSTYEALERIALELAGDVVRVLGGRPASGAVNAPMLQGEQAERAGQYVDLAFRLGVALPQLFDDGLRHEIALVLQGELDGLDPEPFAAALLAGALPYVTDRRVSLVNAVALAREIGVRTVVSHDKAAAPFRSALVVASGDHRIVGTVLPHGPRIIEIDGYEIDAVADGTMALTRHRDVPGMVGRIGTILGNADVNISTMQVARTVRGGVAMMVLEVDRDIDRDVVDAIAHVGGMESVRVVRW
jgi:D-3-phosphoglycerate dehydrogenase